MITPNLDGLFDQRQSYPHIDAKLRLDRLIGLDDQILVEVRSGVKEGEQVVLAQVGDEAATAPAQPR